jgi:predicted pyridoxine 5'-phosphate oxidase superfamily flavin-nucleotide-binding protein
MGHRFAELAFTPRVQQAQEAAGSRANYARLHGGPDFNDVLGPDEEQFLAARDSLYLATVGETGWPYVQHRGGPPGFVKVLDERTIGFADFRGNRQYVSVGNLAGDQRIALIAVDYPRRRRLKLLGHARIVTADAEPALLERLRTPAYRARVERGIVVTIAGFDWNCPQHITPRYTEAEIAAATQPLRDRIAQLELELQSARARLAER